MRLRKQIFALTVVVATLLDAGVASACPGCKEGVADQPDSNGVGLRQGYFWSILLMAGMPFGLATAGGLAVTRAVKRGMLPEL
jgi:hypothetical protein